MKKTINLKQSQVKTLVEQALNELDWKTYMNAAKKAQERIQYDPFYDEDATDADFADHDKNYFRVPRFVDAARDAYRKKYGSERKDSFETYTIGDGRGVNPYNYERSYGDDYGENEELPDDDYWYSQTQTFFPETEDIPSDDFSDADLSVHSRYGEENDGAVFDEPYRNLVDTNDSDVDLSKTSPEFRDVYNYHHGNSQYAKGQGWNESVARRVTENVIRLLKEQFNADDHTVIFDRPEEALRFIQKHRRGKETLAINTDKLFFGGGQVMVPNEDAVDFMTEMLDWGIDWDKAMERHTGGYAKLLTKDVILAYLKWLNEKEKGLYFTTNYDKNGNQKPLGRFATTMKDVYGQ
ncbi:MAG: hypothetical protein LUD72_07870 [Bacteroidales bacterium]|nr:hypothetical protein [Bacteroidales bacterium]